MLESEPIMNQNRKFPDTDVSITNAQLRMTLLAIRAVLHNKGVVLALAAIGKKDLSLKSMSENFQPAMNPVEYANLFAHIKINPQFNSGNLVNPAGETLLTSIGRAYFREILNQNQKMTGLFKTFLSLWGEEKRVRFVLQSLVSLQKKIILFSEPSLREEDGRFIFNDYTCPYCEGQRSEKDPICEFSEGLFREAIFWATGEEYTIEETHCRARGDESCRYSISRFPTQASTN